MKTKSVISISRLISRFTRQWLIWMVAFLAFGSMTTFAGNGALGDTNIKYFGRWVFTNSAQYSSYWGGAYIKVNFSGTTVKIKLGNTSNYHAKIDNGPWITYTNASGTLNLTPTPLASGTHFLSVAQGRDYSYVFNFQGLILDAGATTSLPTVAPNLIEYIGDSITTGYTDPQADVSDYAWVCSENLGVEHTQIAYPGIALVSGFGVNGNKTGMDVQYFKERSQKYTNSPDWNFTKYTAKVVVINIGQNDSGDTIPQFENDYTNFMAGIRAKFPNADIFAMRPFWGSWAAQILWAVNARIAAGDAKVHYIDTTNWLIAGTSDYGSGVHPSVSGHIKAANHLQPILAPYVSSGSLANGTYKLIVRHSGLALDVSHQSTTNGSPTEQWTYNGGNNQRWTVTSLGGTTYKIVGVQSERTLEVAGASTANGALVDIFDSNNGANQKWTITPTDSGYYSVVNVNSGKAMEVFGGITATNAGAAVDQWSGTQFNQQWSFQAP